MPARRLLMRKIREVLQLRHEQGLSHQAVARACGVGVGTVNRYLRRVAECGLGWPLPADLDDAALEARLFPRAAPVRDRVRSDCAQIHRELKRGGVTLQLLWEEYAQVHPDGYRYTQFCAARRDGRVGSSLTGHSGGVGAEGPPAHATGSKYSRSIHPSCSTSCRSSRPATTS